MELFLEEGGGRPRALWRLLLQYLGYSLTLPLFASLLVAGHLLILRGREAAGGGVPGATALSGTPTILFIGAAASLMAVALSAWVAGRFLDRRPFAEFGFHLSGGWWLDLCFGLALGALLMTAIFLVELALGWVSVSGTLRVAGLNAPFALAILMPLATFVFIGVYEELLFRGYQLRNAAEGLNYPALGPRGAVVVAWVLSSVFFGLLHAGNPGSTSLSVFNIALAGLMLGLGYVLTGELAIPIGLHVSWNFFQGHVYGFPVSGLDPMGATFVSAEQGGPGLWTGGAFGPEAGLLGASAMIAGGLFILLWVRLRRGRTAVLAPIAGGTERSRPVDETPSSPEK